MIKNVLVRILIYIQRNQHIQQIDNLSHKLYDKKSPFFIVYYPPLSFDKKSLYRHRTHLFNCIKSASI